MAHTCDRESCKTSNVTGPKANCFGCKKLCYFGCFGVSINQVAFNQHGKQTEFTPTSNIQFVCDDCLSPGNASSQAPSNGLNDSMNTPRAEKITIKGIMTEVAKLQQQFETLQSSSNAMNNKLDSIEVKTNDIKSVTETVLSKTNVLTTNANEQTPMIFGSSSQDTRPFRPKLFGKTVRTYASVAAENGTALHSSTPSSSKRRRFEKSTPAKQMKKPEVPTPQMGTNTNATGLVVVDKPVPKKMHEKKQTFATALWVSRFGTNVSEEDIRQHIETNTSASSNFTVRKLVKKDQDLSTLNFVSFKIDLNKPDFDILHAKSVWPVNVRFREFRESKPATLGEFLPANLNDQTARKSPTTVDMMDLTATSPGKASDVK